MPSKQPVLLVVLVQTSRLRWFAAAVDLEGAVLPLVCSEETDLDPYLGISFDEQVSFLRHRFCGILQRGCDRLWPRGMKAAQVIIIFERPLDGGELTQRVAEHFVQWMSNPPVAVYAGQGEFRGEEALPLVRLVGDVAPDVQSRIDRALPVLYASLADACGWEVSPKKVRKPEG